MKLPELNAINLIGIIAGTVTIYGFVTATWFKPMALGLPTEATFPLWYLGVAVLIGIGLMKLVKK